MNPSAGIMIVDDTPENLTVLRDILTRAGYRVRPLLDGAHAIRSALAEPPALILLDIMMPGMDGYEVCRKLKEHTATSEIPVLFISALDGTASKIEGFEAGGLDYIVKPFRHEEVLARVKTHLELRHARLLLQEQNEALREAAVLRDDVERILRHDLRSSVGTVISYAELIAHAHDPAAPTAQHAEIIAGAGYTILGMIHSSFDLMKMERGLYALEPEPFDLAEVLRQVVAEQKLPAGQKRLRWSIAHADGPDAQWLVLGEKLLCHSLLLNLVKNAIEAAPEDTEIRCVFALVGDRARISLRNAGAVPEAIRERFFEKFVTAGKTDGSGLGTYSARLMAETQQGTLELGESVPNETTVLLTLPVPDQAARDRFQTTQDRARQRDFQTASAPLAGSSALVLVADDDASNREFIRHILPAPRFQIAFASHGHEALAALQELSPAVALIDLEMSGLHGLDVVRQYREWLHGHAQPSARTVLIAFSAHQDASIREQCLHSGFDRFLSKPISKVRLLDELEHMLQSASALVHLERDMESLIPEFLDLQEAQIHQMSLAIEQSESLQSRSIAHRLQGSFSMHGFSRAARTCAMIDESAKAGNFEAARRLTQELQNHLKTLEIRYV